MVTKEQLGRILKPFIERPFRHTTMVSEENAIKAMEKAMELLLEKKVEDLITPDNPHASTMSMLLVERLSQIAVKGYTPKRDDGYVKGELAMAAGSYALAEDYRRVSPNVANIEAPFCWRFNRDSWKPTPNDRLKELTKAGALIIAEMERLLRIEGNEKRQE